MLIICLAHNFDFLNRFAVNPSDKLEFYKEHSYKGNITGTL